MCGIAGFWQKDTDQHTVSILHAMTDTLKHRGPDADGYWLDCDAGIALGHRRLSIIDLSPSGAQPMISRNERFVLTFNGEIYNFQDIRQTLKQRLNDITFRGTSDTEVMLAAFEQWGILESLKRFTGMYAFAVWDRETRKLYLVRDRMGEKPLYYGWMGETFLFGSELSALRCHPAFRADINRDALTMFMRYQYVPTPLSIFEGIYKLPPASVLTLDFEAGRSQLPTPHVYWSLRDIVEAGSQNPIQLDDTQAIERLETLLMQSIAQQMIADVPLGAFLSGGIDSSTVVALMQKHSSQPVKTFSIGFAESQFNEAQYAKKVAKHLGTDHTELYVTQDDALNVIPRLPTLWNEPFADSSQIPTFLVSELAQQHVTVSLSGDGGDELFGGYSRYFRSLDLYQNADRVPNWQIDTAKLIPHRALGGVIVALRKAGITSLSDYLYRVRRLSQYGAFDVITDYRNSSLSHWQNPTQLVLNGHETLDAITDPARQLSVDHLITKLTYFDMSMYLPDDILVKVDRAAMGVSLETRVPLLNHHVVEFSQALPIHMKIRNGQGKWILRQVLYRHVPSTLVDRPKMGFGIPIERWLRDDLRDWAESLLDPIRMKNEGYLNADLVQTYWKQHLSGLQAWHYLIWDVLMFQAWLEQNG